MLAVMTIHGFRCNIKENNLKNSTLSMFKIQPYIDAIGLYAVKKKVKSSRINLVHIHVLLLKLRLKSVPDVKILVRNRRYIKQAIANKGPKEIR